MDDRRLDLSLLERAAGKLTEALSAYHASPQNESLRDSVVIRYVFTYELFVKALSRFVELEHLKFTPESEMTRSKVVRRANDLGVLRLEWEDFVRYRDARNSVAHTYSESKALQVVELAHSFAEEVHFVIGLIKEMDLD